MIILTNKNLFSTFFASSFFLSWLFDNQEIIGIISYHIIIGNKKISMIDKNSIHVTTDETRLLTAPRNLLICIEKGQ